MKKGICCAAVALVLGTGGGLRASFPCGIYARIDEVKLETKDRKEVTDVKKAERVRLYGDFILILTSGRKLQPASGFLYFEIVGGKENICRAEWSQGRRTDAFRRLCPAVKGLGNRKLSPAPEIQSYGENSWHVCI